MALQKNTVLPSGIDVQAAYFRVCNVSIENKVRLNFTVKGYKDTTLPNFTEQVFSTGYNINGENPIKQAYIYLKSTPEFSGSEDV